jgi:hypothetical protein
MSSRRYSNQSRFQPQVSEEDELEFMNKYGLGGTSNTYESLVRAEMATQPSFDYEQLDQRYPVKTIRAKIAEENAMNSNIQELEYKKSLLSERQAEVGLKKASRDLDMFEATINREDAMLEQVPLARQALGSLDPRDPEYITKRMDVYNQYPLAFEYEPFVNTVDKPLLYRNQQLVGSRREAQGTMGQEITFRDYKDAIDEVGKINRIAMQERGVTEEQLKSGEGYSDMELELLEELQSRISQYRAQRGGGEMPQGEPPLSPEPEDEGFSQQEYRPQSREEFNAIPSGAIFIDPQGNRRVKP